MLNVPVFVALLVYYKNSHAGGEPSELLRHLATGVFLLTFVLDALDGYIARKRNEITRLGSLLDPIADKSLLISAIVLLGDSSAALPPPYLPVWYVVLMISRDIVLVAGSLFINVITGTLKVKPSWWGKLATFLQIVAISVVLLRLPGKVLFFSVIVSSVLAVISGTQYVAEGIRQIDEARTGNGRRGSSDNRLGGDHA